MLEQTTEQIAVRDNQGKFLPGNKLGGRMPKKYETGIVEAFKQRYPPEEIIKRVDEAWELAKSQKSSRAMTAIIELIIERQYGKPAAVTQSPSGISEALAMILADDTPLIDMAMLDPQNMGSNSSNDPV